MSTQPRIPTPVLQAIAITVTALAVVLSAVAIGIHVGRSIERDQTQPTVTHVVPQQSHECREAAQWYYEGFVAMVAESAELVEGTRTADEQWLSERIGPLLNEQEGVYWNQYRVCQGLEPVEFDQ